MSYISKLSFVEKFLLHLIKQKDFTIKNVEVKNWNVYFQLAQRVFANMFVNDEKRIIFPNVHF